MADKGVVEATIFRPLTIFSFKHFGANRKRQEMRQTEKRRERQLTLGGSRRRVV